MCGSSTLSLSASDIGLRGNHSPGGLRYLTYRLCGSRPFGRCNTSGLVPSVQMLSDSQPFTIGGGGADSTDATVAAGAAAAPEADYWIAAPVFSNGWSILGEAEKLVPVSMQRIVSFEAASDGAGGECSVSVVLTGAASRERRSHLCATFGIRST